MLNQILNLNVYDFLMIFVRIGAALMVMVGFGGLMVPVRVRLLFALVFSVALMPVLGPLLPARPAQPASLTLLIFEEATIGLYMGLISQFLITAVQLAGAFMSFLIGISNAFSFDDIANQQSEVLTTFLTNLALVAIFITGLDHLMQRALVDSYSLFPPGKPLFLDDFSSVLARTLSASFVMGLRLAAPLLVFGLVFYAGMGLLSRLVPQMQVFFVAMPIQVLFGLWLVMVSLPVVVLVFLRYFANGIGAYVAPG